MARQDFIDNLRRALRLLPSPKVKSEQGIPADQRLADLLDSADLWLTPKAVEGFEPAEFDDWPQAERAKLQEDIAAYLAIARDIPSNKPANKTQSAQARKHLKEIIKLVRSHLLPEWLAAQNKMVAVATAAASSKGWHTVKDEKEVVESLLGTYKAPRLRIRTRDRKVVLDPIAYFGSGHRGVVDLVVMPSYETAYPFTLQCWRIRLTRVAWMSSNCV